MYFWKRLCLSYRATITPLSVGKMGICCRSYSYHLPFAIGQQSCRPVVPVRSRPIASLRSLARGYHMRLPLPLCKDKGPSPRRPHPMWIPQMCPRTDTISQPSFRRMRHSLAVSTGKVCDYGHRSFLFAHCIVIRGPILAPFIVSWLPRFTTVHQQADSRRGLHSTKWQVVATGFAPNVLHGAFCGNQCNQCIALLGVSGFLLQSRCSIPILPTDRIEVATVMTMTVSTRTWQRLSVSYIMFGATPEFVPRVIVTGTATCDVGDGDSSPFPTASFAQTGFCACRPSRYLKTCQSIHCENL